MNGSAPNSPATGSQLLVPQKLSPNFSIESAESLANVIAMAITISSNAAAKAPTPTRNEKSAERTGLGNLDAIEGRLFEHDDAGGQRRIAEISREFLTVGERPSHEIHHRFACAFVCGVLIQQQPRKR